jgi:predicted dehydrogenase
MEIKVAVMGLGVMGRYHVQKLRSIEGARVVCAVDPNPAVLAEADLPDGTRRLLTMDGVDEMDGLDAAIIATPPTTHFGIASRLLSAGVHCLVEKPVCTRADDARELLKLARQKGLVCTSGHSERFNPALMETIKRAGRFLYVEAERIGPFPERSVDADVIQDLMVHDLDALSAFEPGTPVDVRAVGLQVLTDKIDIANARIEFESGAVATITASRVSMERRRKFRVFSRNGYFSADLIAKSVRVITLNDENGHREISGDAWEAGPSDPLLEQDHAFVKTCREGGAPATEAAMSIPALELADRIRSVIRKADA